MDAKILIPDLANAVALRKRIPLKEAEAFVKQFFDLVSEHIVSDKLLKIKGLGTFKLVEVQERESINVNNGERIVIPGHMKVAFTPDAQLKNFVNKPFGVFQTVILNENTPIEEMERLGEKTDSNQSSIDDEEDASVSVLDKIVAFSDKAIDKTEDNEPVSATFATVKKEKDTVSVETYVTADESEDSLSAENFVFTNETVNSVSIKEVSAAQTQPVQLVPTAQAAMNTNQSSRWTFLYRLAATIAILLLMASCYMAGYYRIPDIKQIRDAFIPKPEVLVSVKKTEPKPASKTEPEESTKEKAMKEAVDRYPQVPGGKYLIVGTKGVRQMKRGDTLLKMARQEYGHHDFAQYIIVFNQFADPDVIPLGTDVNLPLLMEQAQPQ